MTTGLGLARTGTAASPDRLLLDPFFAAALALRSWVLLRLRYVPANRSVQMGTRMVGSFYSYETGRNFPARFSPASQNMPGGGVWSIVDDFFSTPPRT